MSRRTLATIRRPTPHRYVDDPDTPGSCLRCHLPHGNGVHAEEAIAAHEAEIAAKQAEHHRRIGQT